jgi:hypothetical protein
MGVGPGLCVLPRARLPCARMNRGEDDAAFWPPLGKRMSLGGVRIDEEMLPKFDYYLDKSDQDIVILRRQDGSFTAAFSARGVTREGIVQAAKEDYRKLIEVTTPPYSIPTPQGL